MDLRLIALAFAAIGLLLWPNLAVAQKVLGEGIRELAEQISADASKTQKRRIAVLPFRDIDSRVTAVGKYIAEELGTRLFQTGGIRIVERSRLDVVLAELERNETGIFDPETAKKYGKVLSVDAIVTGTLADLEDHVAINCRMLDTETGEVFAAALTKIRKNANGTIDSALSEDIRDFTRDPVRAGPLTIGFAGCRRIGGGQDLVCEFTVSSNDAVQVLLSDASSASDASARPYVAARRQIGRGVNGINWWDSEPIAQGAGTAAFLAFSDVPPDVGRLGSVHLTGQYRHLYARQPSYLGNRNLTESGPSISFTATFRDVSVQ